MMDELYPLLAVVTLLMLGFLLGRSYEQKQHKNELGDLADDIAKSLDKGESYMLLIEHMGRAETKALKSMEAQEKSKEQNWMWQ